MEIMIFVILGIILLLAALAIYSLRKSERTHKTDYYAFFVMGIVWIFVGILFWSSEGVSTLFVIGVIFTIIGILNKKKWKKNHPKWKQLSKKEKKLKIGIIAVLIILILAGILLQWFKI